MFLSVIIRPRRVKAGMLQLWFPPRSRAHVIALNGCPGSVKKKMEIFKVLYILRHLTGNPAQEFQALVHFQVDWNSKLPTACAAPGRR